MFPYYQHDVPRQPNYCRVITLYPLRLRKIEIYCSIISQTFCGLSVSAPSYLPQPSCFHLPHPPASITFGHEVLQSLLVIFVSFIIYSCTSRSHLQSFLCPFTGLPHIAGAGIEICGFSETAALSASLYFIMIGVQGPNILSSQFHIFYSFFTEQLRILEHST